MGLYILQAGEPLFMQLLYYLLCSMQKMQPFLCANPPENYVGRRSAQSSLQQQGFPRLHGAGLAHGIDAVFVVVAKTIKTDRIML